MAIFAMLLLLSALRNVWPTVIIVVMVLIAARLGWLAISRYRNRMLDSSEEESGWSLEDLEQMRNSGQITEHEFKILRDRMMQTFMSSRQRSKPGKPNSPS